MKRIILNLLIAMFTAKYANSQKTAFVSVLSSNNYLIAAKVLAYRLKKLNSSIPYVIIATEDINSDSIKELENLAVTVQNDQKIDTPYITTHKDKKYQYTKIRLWQMTEFDVIIHLDLDVLPARDISTLFNCGSFCAVFRHSDMFNSGVFVLQTNATIFDDMVNKVENSFSYDGGDQGFLNTYFSNLKYSPMFNPNETSDLCSFYTMKRLSSVFNFDIGMYYINNGRLLVDPYIIHYTMGPTKPWLWWTYPLFDLNWIWLEARKEMEAGTNLQFQSCTSLVLTHVFIVIPFILIYMVGIQFPKQYLSLLQNKSECHIVTQALVFSSMLISFSITEQSTTPIIGWTLFSATAMWMATFLIATYARLRLAIKISLNSVFLSLFFGMFCHSMFWIILSKTSAFAMRAVLAAFFLFLQQVLISCFLCHVLITRSCQNYFKYQIVPSDNHIL